MKKTINLLSITALFAVLALFTQSCDKVKDAVAFDVNQDLPAQHFDLDSTTTAAKGDVKLLYSDYYEINLDSVFEAHEIDKGKLSDGTFKELELSIENPSDDMNFSFVKSLDFKLGESSDPSKALTIASAYNIDPTGTKIVFKLNNENMTDFLEQAKFHYFLYGEITGPVPVVTLPLIIKSKVKFTVNPLN